MEKLKATLAVIREQQQRIDTLNKLLAQAKFHGVVHIHDNQGYNKVTLTDEELTIVVTQLQNILDVRKEKLDPIVSRIETIEELL